MELLISMLMPMMFYSIMVLIIQAEHAERSAQDRIKQAEEVKQLKW